MPGCSDTSPAGRPGTRNVTISGLWLFLCYLVSECWSRTARWLPTPYVVLDQPWPEQPVYLIRPEGAEGPTRILHRNNLRPCPAGVLASPQVPEEGPPGANVGAPPQFNLPGFLVPPCPSRPAGPGVPPRAIHPVLAPGRYTTPIPSISMPIGPPRPSLSIPTMTPPHPPIARPFELGTQDRATGGGTRVS